MKLKETIQFTATNGIKVYIRLDYEHGTVSILEEGKGRYEKKEFCFINRTRDYLGGWVMVFDALKEATVHADKLLQAEANIRKKQKEDKFIELMIGISDLESKA